MPLRALIFDVDGTLAETEEAHRDAFNRAFAEFGLPWHWDQALYRRLLRVSGGKERMREFVTGHDPGRMAAGLDDLIGALHRRKTEMYTATVAAGGVRLRPGIAALIVQARAAGLPMAIATTTTRANVTALLDGAAVPDGTFHTIACAEDAPRKKPDPQVYRLVLERLGVPAEDCLALEDSVNGVRAARAANIPVVVSESVYTAGDDFAGALRVLADFGGVTLGDLEGMWCIKRHPGGGGDTPPSRA